MQNFFRTYFLQVLLGAASQFVTFERSHVVDFASHHGLFGAMLIAMYDAAVAVANAASDAAIVTVPAPASPPKS